ncbi:MAG TPA: GDP-mannose 4,6-dehydratase [Gemmatimonadales bacterium]|nr:GDP-mannose 4,6-dehydratase [Gemmatimonadales bacterium]
MTDADGGSEATGGRVKGGSGSSSAWGSPRSTGERAPSPSLNSGAASPSPGAGRSALVTGAAGFVGRWLCRELLSQGWNVTALSLDPVADDTRHPNGGSAAGSGQQLPGTHAVANLPVQEIHWLHGDVRDARLLARAVDESTPDAVFHLAGVSFVPGADADPGEAFDVNVTATARLLSVIAARRASGTMDPSVVIVGSAEQYGRHDADEMPLMETAEQSPLGVYGATKAAQEIAALQRWRKDGVRVIATRPFNHSGAGQSDRFLLPALVRRALELRESGGRSLPIGNTTPVRDISHVADVVGAYILLAEHGVPGVSYNVCSGQGSSVGELAQLILSRVGADAVLEPDPALVRASDVPVLVGSPARLVEATGWAPTRTLDDLIDDLIHAATH